MTEPANASHLAGKSVLIVGINYRPEPTGNAPYTGTVAEHLVACGADVTVMTAMPYYPYWRVHEGYGGSWRSSEVIGGVKVRRFKNYIPARQTALKRAAFEGSFLLHVLPFALRGKKPDAVLGVVPSLGGGVAAAIAARRFRAPLGLYYHDLVAESAARAGMPGGSAVAGVTRSVERMVVRQAKAIAVVSDGFVPYLRDFGYDESRIRHIRQWTHISPPRACKDELRRSVPFPRDKQIVLHAGAMGLKQGLENVVETARIARAKSPGLHFVFMGDGNQRPMLQSLARDLDNVEFIDPQPDETFVRCLAAADVLLMNERPTMQDSCVPSKLTSYFAAGRPVVAACGASGAAAREILNSGAGIVVAPERPEALHEGIRSVVDDQALGDRLGARGPSYAREVLSEHVALEKFERFFTDLIDC